MIVVEFLVLSLCWVHLPRFLYATLPAFPKFTTSLPILGPLRGCIGHKFQLNLGKRPCVGISRGVPHGLFQVNKPSYMGSLVNKSSYIFIMRAFY